MLDDYIYLCSRQEINIGRPQVNQMIKLKYLVIIHTIYVRVEMPENFNRIVLNI